MVKKIIINSGESSPVQKDNNKAPVTSLKQARILAEGYVEEVQKARRYKEDASYALGQLEELVRDITSQKDPAGDPMSFHNCAATLGTVELYPLACDIIECGLKVSPMNPDLLGDYLVYGIDCGRYGRCAECYETLCKIEKSEWTWRAFTFSIEYIKRIRERSASAEERAKYKAEVTALAKEFKKHLPYMEDGYREYANLFESNPQKELALLQEALENEKLGACPACAFRCADILFAQKRYAEAMKAIERSREDAKTQLQGGINEYYLSFLSGLCKIALADSQKRALSESDVKDIYSDFEVALFGLSGDFRKTVRTRVQFLQKETNVLVDAEFENLLELIGY